MHILHLIISFIFMATLGYAAPAAPPAPVKRANGFAVLYQDINYNGGGKTYYSDYSDNSCHNAVQYNDQYSSTFIYNAQCNFYEHANCKGRKATIRSGAGQNVRWGLTVVTQNLPYPENWNDRISSVICWDY